MNQKPLWKSLLTALVAIALVTALIGTVTAVQTVPAGHVGVEKGYGGNVVGTVYQPGTHLINPLHSVQTVECRPRTYSMVDASGEGDRANKRDAVVVDSINGTTHRVDVTIRYKVNCDRAAAFVQRWGSEEQMEQRLIRPDTRSDVRDEGANIASLAIFKQEGRERLASTAKGTLITNFEGEPIVLDAVKIREVTIPKNLRTELNQRQQAKVRIDTKKHEVDVERQEAERKRVEANSDAEVIAIKGEALRDNPEVLQLRYIEALEKGNTIYVTDGSGSITMTKSVDDETNSTSGGE